MHFESLVAGELAGCAVTLDTLRYLPTEQATGAQPIYLMGFSGQASLARAAWANLRPLFLVCSRETAKLGYRQRPAAFVRKLRLTLAAGSKMTVESLCCPD